ncbi:type I-C CRISPR-associated protein Cas7/Csd2 [Anoxybacillus ayderensis]|uniref:type I-C CRISPR-associated protein Cas7/Csd2 n=1 Tax=Anoxybacillus ayderensis TaxID=265546 RepID=UPI000A271369|nr:type I-C CRISPR-associated protein Cas7/Csd2 [Anoxybacillus ayderensis]OSX53499.1 type I-C CRISPR-associated protein Cas7/Csd2 [Anoxybacillus ayderensis]
MTERYIDPKKRHEFVLLFDVKDGNPNGDPDAGNMPRVDPETMHGIVTDVAIKRKIRDYVATVLGKPIFIQSHTALNTIIFQVYQEIGVQLAATDLSEEEKENTVLMDWIALLEEKGVVLEEGRIIYTGEDVKDADIRKKFTEGLEEAGLKKQLEPMLRNIAKRLAQAAKNMKIDEQTRQKAQYALCQKYYDIRMFGAVMSTGLNAGQVRGPMQLTFSRSVDPVFPWDLTITRTAITKESDRRRKQTEMGRKPLIPYGLYRLHGFYNPFFGERTGVTEEDLADFWDALVHLFSFDHSAARGEMNVRGLYIFSHETAKGSAPAHKLFELVQVERRQEESPRSFNDYLLLGPVDEGEKDISIDHFPGVTITRLV